MKVNEYINDKPRTFRIADADCDDTASENAMRDADIFTVEEIRGERAYTVRVEYLEGKIEVSMSDNETGDDVEVLDEVLESIFFELKDDPTLEEEVGSDWLTLPVVKKAVA